MEAQKINGSGQRHHGAIVHVIREKGCGFAVMSDGSKVFFHQRNFRSRNRIAFSGGDLVSNTNRTLLKNGMVLNFIMGPPPTGKNLPEALDVVLVAPKRAAA